MSSFDFPETTLTPDSVIFEHSLDSIFDCSDFNDVITELCRMVNDRYVAAGFPPRNFPILGTDCVYGTLSNIDYSNSTSNPFKDLESLITKCFNFTRQLLNTSPRYLKGQKALLQLYQDLDCLKTPEWYTSSFSHDDFMNWFYHGQQHPEDPGWVSHQYQHAIPWRFFTDSLEFSLVNNVISYYFPLYENWKTVILAIRKALKTISGDRITTSAKYSFVTAIPMLDVYSTYITPYPTTADTDLYIGEIDPESLSEDGTSFMINSPYNKWPPTWRRLQSTAEDISYITQLSLGRDYLTMGFFGVVNTGITLTKDENGDVWVPTEFRYGAGPRWYKGSRKKTFHYRIGFVAKSTSLGHHFVMPLPNIDWSFNTVSPSFFFGVEGISPEVQPPSKTGTIQNPTLMSLSHETFTFSVEPDETLIPEGSTPLEFIDIHRHGSYGLQRQSEWGIVKGPTIVQTPAFYLKDSSYVFYISSVDDITLVY